ncbi:cation-efflux pump, partial [Chroococcidiopsis cubana CCALA 043]
IYSSDIETAHYIAEEVEARLRDRYGSVRVAIRVEPHNCQSDQISYESATE